MTEDSPKRGRPRKQEQEKAVKNSISWPREVLDSVRAFAAIKCLSFSRAAMELALEGLEKAKKEK